MSDRIQNTRKPFNPVEFADWRLKEFKKRQSAGVLNEGLEMISTLFLEIIGDYDDKSNANISLELSENLFKEGKEYLMKRWNGNTMDKIIAFFFFICAGFFGIIYYLFEVSHLIIITFLKLLGLTKTFSAPIIIYYILAGLSYPQKQVYDGYRMIWLLITYILLYTRNFNIRLFSFFILSTIAIEILLIILSM